MKDGIFLYSSCGSPNYAAPELISGKYYNGASIDIWSCGVILYTLLTGSLPFNEKATAKLYQKIKECKYRIPENVSEAAKDLIYRMLQKDPLNRISIAEIKQHKWFTQKLNLFQIIDNHRYIYGSRTQINKDVIHEMALNEKVNPQRLTEDEIAQKNIEIGRFKKIVNDLKELKNMEIKLKQNDSSNDFNNNDINSQNLNINSLLKEIEEYKSQINKLTKEKEELQKESEMKYIHEGNNTNNDNDKILLKEYLNKISKLEEKNKKLEKLLTKSNQELDQYEIESKEADIEIKSFKMKISELMEEIKKLKHKETIEEVIEENYEEEEDKKENN